MLLLALPACSVPAPDLAAGSPVHFENDRHGGRAFDMIVPAGWDWETEDGYHAGMKLWPHSRPELVLFLQHTPEYKLPGPSFGNVVHLETLNLPCGERVNYTWDTYTRDPPLYRVSIFWQDHGGYRLEGDVPVGSWTADFQQALLTIADAVTFPSQP